MTQHNQNTNSTKRYVVTGGPCVGKTTVLDLIEKQGYPVLPEAARKVIETQQSFGGSALPWKNVDKFQQLVAKLQVRNEERALGFVSFLDRGIVDGYGYCRFFGAKVPQIVSQLGRDRYDKVFVLDRLPSYENDSARREDEETAKGIHQAVIDAYQEFGYEPILVPVLPPKERAEYVLARV